MPYFHVDITKPHSLQQGEAWRRVIEWLRSLDGKDPQVTKLRTIIDDADHTIRVLMKAHGYPITLDVIVTDKDVHLFTNEAENIVESLAMRWKQSDLEVQLSELLK